MAMHLFFIILLLNFTTTNGLIFQNKKLRKCRCNSKKSNEDGHVSKTGRHTYASWHNVQNQGKAADANSNKFMSGDEDNYNMDDVKTKKESFFGGILNKLVFYGLDEMMTTKKKEREKPVFFTKSPFLTVSESIGQKIIDETSQNIDSNRTKSQPKTQIKQRPKNEIKLKTKADLDGALNSLNEELEVLNVTIDDLQLSYVDGNDQVLQKRLSQLLKKRSEIQEKIDMIQIDYVNMTIRE